ncbi:transmembrane protein, putative [Medicago truncatula]|uniref:Transmembrane protein, putative n=1 Tax=Medicago truncatula TaxID=3880 RepID=G7KA40_MEDTR|nr:transmembrane protein, putative [Medicago truncatula]
MVIDLHIFHEFLDSYIFYMCLVERGIGTLNLASMFFLKSLRMLDPVILKIGFASTHLEFQSNKSCRRDDTVLSSIGGTHLSHILRCSLSFALTVGQ